MECASCKRVFNVGCGLTYCKTKLYCTNCSNMFQKCANCKLQTMEGSNCIHCDYKMQTCSKCKLFVDEAVIRLNVVYCQKCAFSPSSAPPVKIVKTSVHNLKTSSSNYVYLPPDSSGCYRHEI